MSAKSRHRKEDAIANKRVFWPTQASRRLLPLSKQSSSSGDRRMTCKRCGFLSAFLLFPLLLPAWSQPASAGQLQTPAAAQKDSSTPGASDQTVADSQASQSAEAPGKKAKKDKGDKDDNDAVLKGGDLERP